MDMGWYLLIATTIQVLFSPVQSRLKNTNTTTTTTIYNLLLKSQPSTNLELRINDPFLIFPTNWLLILLAE